MPSVKQLLTIAAVSLGAAAIAYRIPQMKKFVFDDGSWFG